jgi:hypothetical protein
MSKYDLLLGLVITMVTTSLFGGHFGYEVNGVPQASAMAHEASPGLLGILDFAWDSTLFMFNMTTFQVDGMPIFISAIFLVMGIAVVWLIVNLIRGS